MKTYSEYVARHARRWPERQAVIFGSSVHDYGSLHARALALHAALAARGVQRQDRVAVLAMNCPEWVETGWACAMGSFMLATINYRLAAAEIRFIVQDSAPRVLIFEAPFAAAIDAVRSELSGVEAFICIGDDAAPEWALSYARLVAEQLVKRPTAPSLPAPQDHALLIYTSGTTGRPKGVIKSQAAMLAMFKATAFNLGMRPDDRILITMPMFHTGAMSEAAAMLYTGGTVVVHRRFDAAAALRAIAGERITHVHMAPTMVQSLMDLSESGSRDLSSLRTFNYAAAPMPVGLLRAAIARFGNIFVDIYGLTEVGSTILHPHQHFLDGAPEQVERLRSVGQSTPGAELRVVDGAGRDCPPGMPGEIIIRADTMMTGYWNNSAATIETLRGGWVHTGDIGYLDEQEYLFLVDRKKDMIISGGENIYCREVEDALLQHTDVIDVAVIGVPDPFWGEAVHAVVVAAAASSLTAEDLISFSAALIARYKRPKTVEFVGELPRLPSGKVAKPVLRQRHRQRSGPGDA